MEPSGFGGIGQHLQEKCTGSVPWLGMSSSCLALMASVVPQDGLTQNSSLAAWYNHVSSSNQYQYFTPSTNSNVDQSFSMDCIRKYEEVRPANESDTHLVPMQHFEQQIVSGYSSSENDQRKRSMCPWGKISASCYSLAVSNGTDFSSEQPYMAKDYLDMMWRRNRFQAHILELGFNFVFTDVDIIWFRNPLLRIPVGADIAMSSDVFYGNNPYDLNKRANGGFLYVKSRPRTIAFYSDWYEARAADPGENEQLLFDKVKHELAARHSVVVQFVDTVYLGGFCQPTSDF